ncbi:MAG: WGxxGxxG family protein [Limisphaerales bacterium]
MKKHPAKHQIKKAIAVTALSLFAASSPLMAQSDASSRNAYSAPSDRAPMHEPAGADYTTHSNWSWIGLLGLLGLLGLRHRRIADDTTVRTGRTV